jgi:hypothetical protein
MAFDFHFTIQEDSPEGRVVAVVISRDRVTPEEAVRSVLRGVAVGSTTPAEKMLGAFSSDEDSAILDEAMEHVRAVHNADRLRDFTA